MCLLSYYPPGKLPDLERLKNGAEANEDGYGYAIVAGDKLITAKGLDAAGMIADFGRVRAEHPDGPAMFHSRFGTGGDMTEFNCHPFTVGTDSQTVVAHNGVLFSTGKHERRCDTHVFADTIMPRQYKRLDRPGVQKALERYLGAGNKLVVLTVNPRYRYPAYIFNQEAGYWTEGEWHSNSGYESWGKYARRYLSHKPSWWDESKDCDYCGTANSIVAGLSMCEECMVCTDCGTDDCLCYVPSRRISVTSSGIALVQDDPAAMLDSDDTPEDWYTVNCCGKYYRDCTCHLLQDA